MSEPFVGEVKMFAGNFAPAGWALCGGQLLAIAENVALFSLLGTTYGGDGQNTFGLPDLRGRIPLHQGGGPGLSNRAMGQSGGAETETLTTNQIPSHTHPAACNTGAGTSAQSPVGAVWRNYDQNQYSTAAPAAAMNAGTMLPTGGSQPHENRMPYLAVTFIIALFGIYPSRN